MTKRLILTEKPSVARDLIAALGGFTAKGGRNAEYWESQDWLCTYAVGHLLEFVDPDEINPLYKRWNLDDLPIVPEHFRWRIKPGMDRRLEVIQKLLSRSDVIGLVNACDAAREGELIFREIVAYFECCKPIERLWLQSMTPESIRNAFGKLRPGTDFTGLAAAASCRAKADWLIGMNATRAMSLRLSSRTDKGVWSAGRVQTPTLALLVARELEIMEHQPKEYWRVKGTFFLETGSYDGICFDPKFKKNELKPDGRDDRFFDAAAAQVVIDAVRGKKGTAIETRKPRIQKAPLLFDLTGLQRAMAQRHNWTAKRTLESAQRCYETHKAITYPRTSSAALPCDYREKIADLFAKLAESERYANPAGQLLRDGLKNERRNFDDSKVTDHFAIIPTGYRIGGLSGDDGVLLDAVVRRTMASFLPDAIFDKVERVTQVNSWSFRTGPIESLTKPGWLAVYDRSESSVKDDKQLPALGNKIPADITNQDVSMVSEHTKPPPRIGEAALLGLMEHAGRHVEDSELAAALMKAEGLGTAATRAEIIENLKHKAYIDQQLRPTPKGIQLIDSLQRIGAKRLTSAELTAKLELELNHVESGKQSDSCFMQAIETYVSEVVEASRRADFNSLYPDENTIGKCPVCRITDVFERHRFYLCASFGRPETSCGFYVAKDMAARYISRSECRRLLLEGKTGELEGFSDQEGRTFKAVLALAGAKAIILPTETGREARSNGNVSARTGAKNHEKLSDSIAPCPIHKSIDGCQIISTKSGYACTKRLEELKSGHPNPSGFWMPLRLCQRAMVAVEVAGLIERGSTPELSGFVSKAGKPFKARLVLDESRSWKFDFTRKKTPTANRAKSTETHI